MVTETDQLLRRRKRHVSFVNVPRAFEQKNDDIVEYDGDNHWAVLTQLYGSVWPTVLPWCLAACAETIAIVLLRGFHIVDLTVSNSTGHGFMSLLVSFLLVTRATITYNRFMEARQHLADLYRSSRETVQYACVLSSLNLSPPAVQWRQDVAYKTIVCLRMAQAAVEYRSTGKSAWEQLPENEHSEMELLLNASSTSFQNPESSFHSYSHEDSDLFANLAHAERSLHDENFRAPIVWAYNLRNQILKTRTDDSIFETRPFHVNEELKLLGIVGEFLTAFHGHRKLITTPFPFPMVQMTRTFLFFWVYSLPLVLVGVSDETDDRFYSIHDAIEVLLIMFFCTYGFLGLEYVCVELDDPYGDDPNDFCGQRWSELAFEDIYLTIYKVDGMKSASELKEKIAKRIARGDALELYQQNPIGMTESSRGEDLLTEDIMAELDIP